MYIVVSAVCHFRRHW